MFTAAQIGDLAEREGRSPRFKAEGLAAQGKVFSVSTDDGVRYPAINVDSEGQPRPIVAAVLESMPARSSAWFRALWWTALNPFLSDRRPLDLLDSEDEPLIRAAAAKLTEPLVL